LWPAHLARQYPIAPAQYFERSITRRSQYAGSYVLISQRGIHRGRTSRTLDQKYFVATLALSRAFWSETCISNRRMLRAECLLRAAKGKHLTKYLESVITGTLLGLLPALICSGCIAPAQAQDQFARASSNDGPSNSPGARRPARRQLPSLQPKPTRPNPPFFTRSSWPGKRRTSSHP